LQMNQIDSYVGNVSEGVSHVELVCDGCVFVEQQQGMMNG